MFKVRCYSFAGFNYFQLLTFNFQHFKPLELLEQPARALRTKQQ